ncbi:hypothetical protein VNO77_10534 [Canavalia gladiata]|uniref:Uncharacterized protein n=1 Tax=Canavalia gladiata TaxID=3824 RepID=A0AAN9MBX2_CANGL
MVHLVQQKMSIDPSTFGKTKCIDKMHRRSQVYFVYGPCIFWHLLTMSQLLTRNKFKSQKLQKHICENKRWDKGNADTLVSVS